MMPEPSARLYLITPPTLDAARFAAALAAGDVACVLFTDAVSGDGLAGLVHLAQAHGAAALVADDADLAARLNADGVHIGRSAALADAVRRLKPARIVGAGSLSTRDDAMIAGELGVDYVMLGDEPGEALPFEERLDRVSWWAEIFQVPCVAMARAQDEIEPLVATGAEFIGVGDLVWGDPEGPAAAMAAITEAVAAGHAAFLARQAETA